MEKKEDGKPKGWFSRRHQTSEEHENARARRFAERGWETRQVNARVRAKARVRLSPKEQIRALDLRLGEGTGAARERARLQALAGGG